MPNMTSSFAHPSLRRSVMAAVLMITVAMSTSCSSGKPAASPNPSVPAAATPAPSTGEASPSPSPGDTPAGGLLKSAETAARELKKYAFELQLTQKLTGDSEESNSNVTVDMEGRAELGPLKLDQLVSSDVDGEVYAMRAILVPDAYYMYDPDFEEWSKTSAEQTADLVKTLSDFQVNPAKAVESVRALGAGLELEKEGDVTKVHFEGNGPEAKAFLEKVLESTLDLSGMEPAVRDSIRLGSLAVDFSIDSARRLPLSYSIVSVMTIEYEPGKPSTLAQTMSGSYSKHNASDAVIIPEAAKNAPELDPPLDEEEAEPAATFV